jgi:hypothetical protein
MRRLLLIALLLAGCGPDKPRVPPPLDPPSPETDGLVLENVSGRMEGEQFVPAWECRLELEASKRFRYAWRRVGESTWREILGTWRPSADQKYVWVLDPDAGEEVLEPGEFVAGKRPELEWSSSFQPASGGGPGFGALWLMPAIDPETGRFQRTVWLQQDPRVRAHLEKFLEERR